MVAEGITAAAALRPLVDTLVADLKYAAAVTRLARRIPAVDRLVPTRLAATHPARQRLTTTAASNAAKQPNVRAAVMADIPAVVAVNLAVAADTPMAEAVDTPMVAVVDMVAANTGNR
jgi:hypothetical protein